MISTATTNSNYINTADDTCAGDFLSAPFSDQGKIPSGLVSGVASGGSLDTTILTLVPLVLDNKSLQISMDSTGISDTAFSTQEQQVEIPLKADNPEAVRYFLAQHPELVGHLHRFAAMLPGDLIDSTTIAYYKDIEEHWEKLFLLIDTGIEDFDELEKMENALYGKLIEPLEPAVQEKIVLTVS